jgi:Cu2+-exporting ATPase/Cu+-exporting ATPase
LTWRRAKVKVVGVDCPSCVYAIEKKVKSKSHVRSFKLDVNTGIAEVEYDEDELSLRDLYAAIREAGYDVYKEKLYFDLKDLSAEEAPMLESRILKKKGILDAKISLTTKMAVVTYNPLEVSREEVISELRELGAEPLEGVLKRRRRPSERLLLYRRLGSFIIGLIAVTLSMASMFAGEAQPLREAEALAPFLAGLAISLNIDIVVRGWRSLSAALPVMDSLIALSVTSTFIAGLASLAGFLRLHGGLHASTFFEASAGVIGFIGLGKYLEERLRKRALGALEALATSLKGNVRVVVGESTIEKPLSEVKPGEVVEVRAGEVVLVDGVVVEGQGYVDESSFTGEPVPRFKRGETRDPVLAGSALLSGYLRVRATRVGSETFIANLMEAVREAEYLKPRLARIADKFVGYFTWIVLGTALATLAYWWIGYGHLQWAVMFTAAVLTVACPCALGIATPLVVSLAVLRSSREGILVRAGDAFERVLSSDVVVLDKTGTLTIGKPILLAVHAMKDVDLEKMLYLACSLESRSEHPLARAIIEGCAKKGLKPSEPKEYVHIPGEGVYGVVEGVETAVGSPELASRLGVALSDEVVNLVRSIGSRGNTPVLVILSSEVVAVLEMGDVPRKEVLEVIERLKKRGYRVGLASGDVEASVSYYKELFKLDFAYWALKPNDKAELMKELQGKGHKAIFVGDGINDAPAIGVANVGVAMGGGAEISREAGDVVLVGNDLRALLFLLDFSKTVKNKMMQNIAWAFAYNVVLIPIAAGALFTSFNLFITPQLAALAMILSDISVVANALTILRSRAWRR